MVDRKMYTVRGRYKTLVCSSGRSKNILSIVLIAIALVIGSIIIKLQAFDVQYSAE